MSCSHCLNAVNQALNSVSGARPLSVQMGRAEVEYDEGVVEPAAIVSAIQAAGYDAIPEIPG